MIFEWLVVPLARVTAYYVYIGPANTVVIGYFGILQPLYWFLFGYVLVRE